MKDTYKKDRNSLWGAFIFALLSIPVFLYINDHQVAQNDLITIRGLVLAEDAYYHRGSGKGSTPSIRLKVTATPRVLVINYEEYACVTNKTILDNCRQGDTIAVDIDNSDATGFYATGFFSRFAKIYGLTKNGNNYISLQCRNDLSTKKSQAAALASMSAALVALLFALSMPRPKTGQRVYRRPRINPLLVVMIVWLIMYIACK